MSWLADGATAPAAAAAAARLSPPPDVGVHLDLAALAGGSLARFLVRSALGLVAARDVRRAVREAVGAARARGLAPTHLDAHRHAFLLPSTYRAVAAEAARLGVPAVRRPVPVGPVRCGPGVAGRCKGAVLFAAGVATRGLARAYGRATPDGIVDAEVAAAWAASPRPLPRGTFEVVAHPAAGPDDVPAGDRGPDRAADAARLVGLRAALEARGARVVAFGALARRGRGAFG